MASATLFDTLFTLRSLNFGPQHLNKHLSDTKCTNKNTEHFNTYLVDIILDAFKSTNSSKPIAKTSVGNRKSTSSLSE